MSSSTASAADAVPDYIGAPDGMERRAEPRVAANIPARLFYGPGYSRWMDCIIKDRSSRGAKIRAAVRAGVDAVVVKPAAPDAIRRRLQAVRPQPGCAFLELEDLDLPAARAS